VGLITFRGAEVRQALAPTNSIDQAEHHLRQLPTGGRTPLSQGLWLAAETLIHHQRLHHEAVPLLVIVSDGRANVAMQPGLDPLVEAKRVAEEIHRLGVSSLVIDTETGFLRFGLAREISVALKAKYIKLEELAAGPLVRTVRQELARVGH
jgi:magnesium chelatase subunit D